MEYMSVVHQLFPAFLLAMWQVCPWTEIWPFGFLWPMKKEWKWQVSRWDGSFKGQCVIFLSPLSLCHGDQQCSIKWLPHQNEPSSKHCRKQRDHWAVVVQGDCQHLWSPGLQVQSLAWPSGLRILLCRSCGIGCSPDLSPSLGAPYTAGQPKKEKKYIESNK